MLGTIINSVAILIGGTVGLLLRKGISERFKQTVMQGLGLSVFVIGVSGALKTENMLVVIFSIVFGGIMGEALEIEEKLEVLGRWMEKRVGKGEGLVAKGFVTTSLIYCVGAMAIVGALESGMTGNHETLYAKSLLDGVSSVIFASTLGLGVLLSSVSVFIYQGLITIAAGSLADLLTEAVVIEMSAVGGLLIIGISMNILEIKKVPVGNLLPAVFIPVFYPLVQPAAQYFLQIIEVFL
ncbi:DUF554 domain-containing protein [Tindallia californiensis]|uniref:DUF554 domain-containing protein n=1 Tax=Tindallia californiensis TaxID=159292 RepID=A0A1H3L6X2_9FIRM|nr:DUF554 domain-containing protein [Tindallia californiensis]SDY60090.1 hypothetical protein SAMN05192546_10390 [Tindallia californiensis]